MDISVLTDEIDPDVFQAIEKASGWGIRHFEIRKVSGQRVPQIPTPVCEQLRDALDSHDAMVTALSPGLFKKAGALLSAGGGDAGRWWEDAGRYREYRSKAFPILERTLELAARLGASSVIVFTPEAPPHREGVECPGRLIELIREAAELAGRHGMRLLLENDFGLWADTGTNAMRILTAAGRDNLKMNWDPANAYVSGERPFPDGYGQVRNVVGNVHAKDATRNTPPVSEQYEVLGEGEIDWPGQIRALVQDGYDGAIGIETHAHPLIEKTYRNVLFLRRLIGQPRGDDSPTPLREPPCRRV